MRSLEYLAAVVLMGTVAVSCSLSKLEERLDSLEIRIADAEKSAGVAWQNAVALRRIYEKDVWIEKYEEVKDENSKVIGYVLSLNDGTSIKVIYGLEAESLVPLIGIDSEGHWIVSLDDGNTFKRIEGSSDALSEDGITPQLKVDALGFWLISTDGGQNWSRLLGDDGKPVSATASSSGSDSSSIFREVNYDSGTGKMVFTLADGQVVSLDVVGDFVFTVEGYESGAVIFYGKSLSFRITESGVTDALFKLPDGWDAAISDGWLTVSAPSSGQAGEYMLGIVLVSEEGRIKTVNLVFTLSGLASGLPDFSYAGYNHGESAPPEADGWGFKVYNVCDYGAVPDDGKSDREAFLKCLKDALGVGWQVNSSNVICFENKVSANAIVYFPEGEFILHTSDDDVACEGKSPSQTIQIRSGNFILRGAGRDKTTLVMQDPNQPSDASILYSSPTMIDFKHNSGLSKLTDVTAAAAKGSFSVEVSSAAGLSEGQWVCLTVVNNDPAFVKAELAAGNPSDSELSAMTNIVNGGVQVYDYHQIKSISGNKVTFCEPIMHEVDLQYTAYTNAGGYNWRIDSYPHYENVGIEDLTFKGNAKADFSHHGSWQDDGAYKPVNLTRLVNSWVRRVGFESVSEACSIIWSANVSAYDITFGGNRGHAAMRSQCSSRVFIGATTDTASGYLVDASGTYSSGAGQYHAVGVSKQSMGTVLWRNVWGNDSCFESHATQPRATLIDCCTGGWMKYRQGGDQAQVPNHLDDLVIWNFRSLTPQSGTFNFWDHSSLWWKFLPPVIVGFHGEPATFDESQVKLLESNGTAVAPESLYEQQLKARLGALPAWLAALK